MTFAVLVPERPVRPEVDVGLPSFLGLAWGAPLSVALWAVIILAIWRLT